MNIGTSPGVRITLVATLSLLVLHAAAWAQIEEVDKITDVAARLIYVAKSIKKLVLTPVEDTGESSEAESFEIVAKDADGNVVDISAEDAQKLFKWTAKDSSGNVVARKGTIERLESTNDKLRKIRTILRLAKDSGSKAVRLEMHLAEEYTTYSVASGTAAIAEPAVAAAGAGGAKSWVVRHPYWAAAGGVAVVGGGIAAAGGGGGGSSSDGGVSSDPATGGGGGSGSDPAAYAGHMAGAWSGMSDGGTFSGTFSMNIAPDGTITGSLSGDETGSLSGTVSGNGATTARGSAGGGSTWTGNLHISGGVVSGSGTWVGSNSSGVWSGGG